MRGCPRPDAGDGPELRDALERGFPLEPDPTVGDDGALEFDVVYAIEGSDTSIPLTIPEAHVDQLGSSLVVVYGAGDDRYDPALPAACGSFQAVG